MTTTIYKLTNQNVQTRGGFQWALAEWREANGKGGLCSDGMLHCYSHPLLAVLLNPIHANIKRPRLFEGEGEGEMLDDRGLKQGFKRMRITKELPLPVVTTEQRVKFAILCALEVYREDSFVAWAKAWLDGSDRSARAATRAAADAAADAACAARAARAADAAAAYAVYAAANAANAAADAARAVAREGKTLDLIAIALKAMEE